MVRCNHLCGSFELDLVNFLLFVRVSLGDGQFDIGFSILKRLKGRKEASGSQGIGRRWLVHWSVRSGRVLTEQILFSPRNWEIGYIDSRTSSERVPSSQSC